MLFPALEIDGIAIAEAEEAAAKIVATEVVKCMITVCMDRNYMCKKKNEWNGRSL